MFRGKIASYVGIKILENSRVAERLCLFKVMSKNPFKFAYKLTRIISSL